MQFAPCRQHFRIAFQAAVACLLGTPASPVLADTEDSDDLFGVSSRRDQYAKDFAYFAFPFVSTIPGFGTAYGGTDTETGTFSAGYAPTFRLRSLPKPVASPTTSRICTTK